MRWIVCNLLWLSFATTAAIADEPAEKGALSAKLSVKVDGPLLADFPLLLKLTMTNAGEKPIHFWCGGPAVYPSASYFTVTLINDREAPQVLSLSNGQYEMGSGGHIPIKDSQEIPAVCGPVPAGKYVLVVQGKSEEIHRDSKTILIWPTMKSEQIEIEVIEDREKLKEAEQAILNRAKQDQDPFAAHASLRFGIDPIVETWLKQLRATPKEIGFAPQLGMVERFPNGTDLILKEVCEKRSQVELPPKQRRNDSELILLVRRFKTDAAVDALLFFADSTFVSSNSRELAVGALIELPQPKVRMRLHRMISDTSHPSHWMAIRKVTFLRDPLAIQALLKHANDKDAEARLAAIQALSWFREDLRAKDCLEKAKSDKDKSISETAKKALFEDLLIRPGMRPNDGNSK